jgi:ABC-type oligopeptide transport system substrate-binding subunit
MRRPRHENREHRKAIKLARRRNRITKRILHQAKSESLRDLAKLLRNRRLI